MLDFLFRRGNPTNHWQRLPSLRLDADLGEASLNGVFLGQRLESLAFLGRDEDTAAARVNVLRYYTLGLDVDVKDNATFEGFSLILCDRTNRYHPFVGAVKWNQSIVELGRMNAANLQTTFGESYWIDTDDDETIVFYEFPNVEWQMECSLDGRLERVIVTKDPLMSAIEQRTAYRVTRPWPPEFRT